MTEHSFFGEDATFHHIGLGVDSVRDLDPQGSIRTDKIQKVALSFVQINGVTVELLEPRGDSSPIARSLRDGVKLLHLAFEVDNLEAALEFCRPAGFHCLQRPVPAEPLDGRRIAWVFSKQYGLFELVERAKPPN